MSPEDGTIRSVAAYLDRHELIPDGSSVLVALSGGPDSVCLFHVLRHLAPARDWHLTALHMNHQLRGDDSDGDEVFVRALCDDADVPLRVVHADIRSDMQRKKLSLETAARDARYAFFRQVREERTQNGETVRIAVAHHADDQAETLLMHLFRGSGLDGLTGMAPQNGPIVRPLLECSKKEILAFLESGGLPYRTDTSNFEAGATRNRVRLELLPLAASIFGGDTASRLASTASLLRADADALSGLAEGMLASEEAATGIPAAWLTREPPALAARLVRGLYEQRTGSRVNLGSVHVQAVCNLAAHSSGRVDLPGRTCAVLNSGRIRIRSQEDETKPNLRSVPDPVALPDSGSVRFVSSVFTVSGDPEGKGDRPAFSRERLQGAVIRTRRAGDWIRPQGGSGSRLLRRFFIDRHVPVPKRDQLPLVAVGKKIVWIPGVVVSSTFLWSEKGDSPEDRVWLTYCPNP